MAETKRELIRRIGVLVNQNGKAVTDEQVREAVAREYNDFLVESFDPSTPAPQMPREKMESIAEYLMEL